MPGTPKTPSSGSTPVGVPKALVDFVFDLYESVTLSQIPEEQQNLYSLEFPALCQKYFTSSPWPLPTAVASECDGSPLFLSLYRELTHRYACNKPSGNNNGGGSYRPTLHDRLEAWQVYQTVCEEILECPKEGLYLLPQWTFDILQEFVYQFQGYCQLRSAIYATARKQGLLNNNNDIQSSAANTPQLQNLLENLQTIQANPQAWNVEAVYSCLYRLIALGQGPSPSPTGCYLRVFGSIVLSRLECLLGDYQGCLDVVEVIDTLGDSKVPSPPGGEAPAETYRAMVNACWGARISLVYHSSIAHIMLQRYPPALAALSSICSDLLRHFKTGQLNRHEYSKPYDRMLSLLVVLEHVTPARIYKSMLDDSLTRVVQSVATRKDNDNNNNSNSNNSSNNNSIVDHFAAPKFISTDPHYGLYRQQLQAFASLVQPAVAHEQLGSLLDLYHQVDLSQLQTLFAAAATTTTTSATTSKKNATAGSGSTTTDPDDILALLLSYQRLHGSQYTLDGTTVHVTNATSNTNSTPKKKKWEEYFLQQMGQSDQVIRMVRAIDTNVV